MSDWSDYLDMTHGTPLTLFGLDPHEPLIESGVLRPGVWQMVLSDMQVAKRFLALVADGHIDFACQQGLLRLLLDILHQVNDSISPWRALKADLSSTLKILGQKIGVFLEAHGARLQVNEDDLSYAHGLGQGVGSIQYGLPIARTVALKAFIEAFCKRHADASATSDLNGHWYLEITEPKVAEFSREFAGIYGGAAHAEIKQISGQPIWHLEFLNFPPWHRWYFHEKAAYEAAAPIVAHTLTATVRAVGELED